MSLEIVTWRDAHFNMDEPSEDSDDYLVKTVGWTFESGRFLKIRSEKLPRGDGYRSVTRVPLENVVRRQTLRKQP